MNSLIIFLWGINFWIIICPKNLLKIRIFCRWPLFMAPKWVKLKLVIFYSEPLPPGTQHHLQEDEVLTVTKRKRHIRCRSYRLLWGTYLLLAVGYEHRGSCDLEGLASSNFSSRGWLGGALSTWSCKIIIVYFSPQLIWFAGNSRMTYMSRSNNSNVEK